MDNEKRFVVRFKKQPKKFKKYVKNNYEVKKKYEAKEANKIYNDTVKSMGITGKMVVIMECIHTKRIICDVEIEVSPTLSLDVALMNEVTVGIEEQGESREEINLLISDFEHAFGWKEQQEHQKIRERLEKRTKFSSEDEEMKTGETVESVESKKQETSQVEDESKNETEDEIDFETEFEIDLGLDFDLEIDKQLKEQKNANLKDEKLPNELLDVSTLNTVVKLKEKAQEHYHNFKQPITYLSDIFDLQSDSSYVENKKQEYIKEKCVSSVTSFLKSLYEQYDNELIQIKKRAKELLSVEYREVQSENYVKVEEQMEHIENEMQQEFEEKKNVEVAKIEKIIQKEFEEKIKAKRFDVENQIFANLNDKQKQQLNDCRELVENELKDDVQKMINEKEAEYQKFIESVRSKLQAKQFDFEREYNNLEMQKMRQEVLEEQQKFQQQMLEMQKIQNEMSQQKTMNQVVVDAELETYENKSSKVVVVVLIIFVLIGLVVGGFFFFRLEFVENMMREFLTLST